MDRVTSASCCAARRPPHVEHPELVDIAAAIEILNSRDLDDEIWSANNQDPAFEA